MIPLAKFFYRQSRWQLTVGLICGLISGGLTGVLIAMVNKLVSVESYSNVITFAIFIVVCSCRLLFGLFSQFILIRLSQGAICDLRMLLCRQILKAPLSRLEQIGSSKIINVLTEDVSRISELVVNLPYFFINAIILLACICYLSFMSPAVVAVTLLCLGVGVITYLVPVYMANKHLRQARQHESVLFRYMTDVVEGAKELKQSQMHREDFMSKLLVPAAENVKTEHVRGISIYASAATWNRSIFFIYIAGVAAFSQKIFGGSIHELASYTLVLLYMMAPLEAVMNVLPLLARAGVAINHAETLGLLLQPGLNEQQNVNRNSLLSSRIIDPDISVEGLTYSYRSDDGSHDFCLGPLNLTMRPGEITFVTGGNGSGKTTFAKLICGLYEPASGTIKINGQVISDRDAYRDLFATVFSDFHLFQRLVGVPESHIDNASEHLKKLGLDHKIRITDATWSTLSLSRGQRKRLALLLALISDRPIFIFDEWAADQDPYFKHVFYCDILQSLKKQKKVILAITHDDRYFHIADRLFNFDMGHIIQHATACG